MSVPDGFLFSGVHSGVKKSGKNDLGLAYSSFPASVAGVFTENKLPAAPVVDARRKLEEKDKFRGLVANSGVANAATGPEGTKRNRRMVEEAAGYLSVAPEEIIPASTGLIGKQLPVEEITASLPEAVDSLDESLNQFSKSILTTDTKIKTASVQLQPIDATMVGVAKGSGMINPRMATMLSFVFVDYPVNPGWWQDTLAGACESSFNRITVDGDMSTNDTVLAFAADMPNKETATGSDEASDLLAEALQEVCSQLAGDIVRDGEGSTCVFEVRVRGAASKQDAENVAAEVAGSSLVRTAFYGRDPNWGRIYSSVGAAGPAVEPGGLKIALNNTTVYDGEPLDPPDDLAKEMKNTDEHVVEIDLQAGNERARKTACDLSEKYVKINSAYQP